MLPVKAFWLILPHLTEVQSQNICLKNGKEMWIISNKAHDIPGPGSVVHEIKHVQFWGSFTNTNKVFIDAGKMA